VELDLLEAEYLKREELRLWEEWGLQEQSVAEAEHQMFGLGRCGWLKVTSEFHADLHLISESKLWVELGRLLELLLVPVQVLVLELLVTALERSELGSALVL